MKVFVRIAVVGAFAFAAGPVAIDARAAAPPPAVTVAPVVSRNIAPAETYVGHVIAIESVKVVARVTAFIDAIPVKQGSNVNVGEVLFELQKAQYQDAVDAARAQLASADAALKLAQVTLVRAQRLASRQFESVANLNQAQATAAQDAANLDLAKANLAQAELNLGYCTIVSPIKGRIGAVTLTKGNLVTPTSGTLATVVQIDPIRVVFPIPDQTIVASEKKAGTSASTIAKGLVVTLELPDGKAYGHAGKVAFLENQVNQQTGTVNVYADFPNPDGLLLPGTFVSVAVRPEKPEEQLEVPVEALQIEKNGTYVLVVGAGDKVRRQAVKVGRQIGQDYIVESGLSEGDRVIVEGVQKVRPGETVRPTVSIQPGTAGVAELGASD